jgi:hypothetical protein
VRQLVDHQPVEPIGRVVERQHHALPEWFGEGAHPLLRGARNDVLLLELAVGLEENHLHLEGQVVVQVGADLLVGTLRVAGNPLEMLLDFGVVVDLEVLSRVDVPLEVVVMNVVLAEIGHKRCLGGGSASKRRQKEGGGDRCSAHMHTSGTGYRGASRDLTVTAEALQRAC